MSGFSREELREKIEKGGPLRLTFHFTNREVLMIISGLLSKILAKTDHLYLLNSMGTVLREILVNAQKANAKRVYFLKNNLNISDPVLYQEGMKAFHEQVIGDFESIEKDMESSDFYVAVLFHKREKDLLIRVENNTPILPEELKRIQLRLKKAKEYNDFAEAYAEVEDETEGAGLGIVLTVLFLKNMGIDPDCFRIDTEGSNTVTSVIIPDELRDSHVTGRIKKDILDEIKGIPTFPENVVSLLNLCNDSEASIDEIARRIMMDPALTTDVIKLSNSAGFFPGRKIENVLAAIMTIGLKNVRAILMASNARRILDQRYSSFEEIWKHCNKTAVYARHIAMRYNARSIAENAFMAGLLHDLGKIILLSTELDLVEKIANTVRNRKIVTTTVMEEISIGVSHPTIGSLIAEKWNFPDYLVDAICHHHSPLSARPQHRDTVFTVYLANMLCGIEDRRYYYYYIEEAVLERFDLLDEKKFRDFHESMKKVYSDFIQ